MEVKDKIGSSSGIKVEPFWKHVRQTKAHKHNKYFEIIYLFKGSGQHIIDALSFEIKPPVAFSIRREQVHFWDMDSEPEGFVLIIKKSFIDGLKDHEIRQVLGQLSATPCTYPSDEKAIKLLFELLVTEISEYKRNNASVVEGLLKALLIKLQQGQHSLPSELKTKESLYLRLQELLATNKTPKNSVAHYAQLLHTSPQNLSAACRKEARISAAQVLSEHIINEAKRLLLYTDWSITQIADALDFNDNSHFTKYFKRHTSTTPTAFRNSV